MTERRSDAGLDDAISRSRPEGELPRADGIRADGIRADGIRADGNPGREPPPRRGPTTSEPSPRNVKNGPEPLSAFLDRYVVSHKAGHLEQLCSLR